MQKTADGNDLLTSLKVTTRHLSSTTPPMVRHMMGVLTPLLTPLSAQHAATASKENGLDKRLLQPTATSRNRCRRIVAPKVAGSSPVGHPPICTGTFQL